MPLLDVALVPAPDRVVVRLVGECDLSSVTHLDACLDRARAMSSCQVVVDVAAARFWDLSGLYALIELTTDLAAEGRSCRIVGAPPATRRLIDLASLHDDLHLDGPLPARTPVSRPTVPIHGVPARLHPAGDLALVPGGGSGAERRGWRRRG